LKSDVYSIYTDFSLLCLLFYYPPPSISNGDLPVTLGAAGGLLVVIFAGGDGGELPVKLARLCTVLFAEIAGGAEAGEGGETGAAVGGGTGGAAEADGSEAGGGIGIFKQGVGISMLEPGTSEQRINEVPMPNIGRPQK
jgi:hypothetical protein